MLTLPRDVAQHFGVPIPDDLDLDDCLSEEEIKAIHRDVEARYAAERHAGR